jgi:hypothetical protein
LRPLRVASILARNVGETRAPRRDFVRRGLLLEALNRAREVAVRQVLDDLLEGRVLLLHDVVESGYVYPRLCDAYASGTLVNVDERPHEGSPLEALKQAVDRRRHGDENQRGADERLDGQGGESGERAESVAHQP